MEIINILYIKYLLFIYLLLFMCTVYRETYDVNQ